MNYKEVLYLFKACSFAFFSSVKFFCNLSIVFLCIWMLDLTWLHSCCNICICVPRRFISKFLSFIAKTRLLKKQDIKNTIFVIYQCKSNWSRNMTAFLIFQNCIKSHYLTSSKYGLVLYKMILKEILITQPIEIIFRVLIYPWVCSASARVCFNCSHSFLNLKRRNRNNQNSENTYS